MNIVKAEAAEKLNRSNSTVAIFSLIVSIRCIFLCFFFSILFTLLPLFHCDRQLNFVHGKHLPWWRWYGGIHLEVSNTYTGTRYDCYDNIFIIQKQQFDRKKVCNWIACNRTAFSDCYRFANNNFCVLAFGNWLTDESKRILCAQSKMQHTPQPIQLPWNALWMCNERAIRLGYSHHNKRMKLCAIINVHGLNGWPDFIELLAIIIIISVHTL